MALAHPNQFFETVRRSTRPLLLIPHGAGPDGYATALGLCEVFEKLGSKPDMVAADGPAPSSLRFLSGHERIQGDLPRLRTVSVELDASRTKLKEVVRQDRDGRTFLTLVTEEGSWEEPDVRLAVSDYQYDLAICLGAQDLDSCAPLYGRHPDFFFRTPIINIDHSPANEYFGHLNFVDYTAAACGEVCHDLLQSADPDLMDASIATAFLTGLIAKTRSFKTPNVTPKTLQTAGALLAHGARRDQIITHLYRTRSVSTLRLWGRALARLKHDADTRAVWTLLSRQDFLHAGAEEEDLPEVMDELIATSPHAHIALLAFENRQGHVSLVLRTEPPLNALHLASSFHPIGSKDTVHFCLPEKTLIQIERDILPLLLETAKKILSSETKK